MLVSSTSMNAAMATTTAISQGLTWGRQGSATEIGDNSIGGSLSTIFASSDYRLLKIGFYHPEPLIHAARNLREDTGQLCVADRCLDTSDATPTQPQQ